LADFFLPAANAGEAANAAAMAQQAMIFAFMAVPPLNTCPNGRIARKVPCARDCRRAADRSRGENTVQNLFIGSSVPPPAVQWHVGEDMASFDPMAAAIDWLDAYRAATLSIVDMYAADASIECGCSGATVLYGRASIAAYWRQRFVEKPAADLSDLQPEEAGVLVSYRVPSGIVSATLEFDATGKIRRSRCGPSSAGSAGISAAAL
jgi:hypothetical protein